MVRQLQYGTWPSPVTPEIATSAAGRFGSAWAEGELTWWSEGRPAEGGRNQIMRRDADGTVVDVLPDGFDARSKVHEYGGGAWWIDRGRVFFVNATDQRVYRIDPGGAPTVLTPEAPTGSAFRYADGRVTPSGDVVVCVREHHHDGMVDNEVVMFPVDDARPDRVQILVTGDDFYMSPRVSPDGRWLAWIAWNHPNMPWDDTELWVAALDSASGSISEPRAIGDAAASVSFQQPEWSPRGELFVVADDTDWWNVYRVEELAPSAPRSLVAELAAEVGLPGWNFDRGRYVVVDDDGRTVIHLTYSDAGVAHLVTVVLDQSGIVSTTDSALDGYVALEPLRSGGGRLVAGATSSVRSHEVIEIDPASHEISVLSRGDDFGLVATSVAEQVSFVSANGRTAYGWYLAPCGVDESGERLEGLPGEAPPLIVTVHGGPTSGVDPGFRIEQQFWTSRGFAILMVDYAGSTGYGRNYRHSLDRLWGVADIEDVAAGAEAMAERDKADPDRTVIVGGSAGGFTVMMALATTDAFAAGVTRYGVSDLAALARDTHKFESRYLDRLIGPWPEAAEIYAARSPINHLDSLDRPMLVLQGTEDRVVPPSQAELVVAALRRRDLPHAYLLFEGEDHGFRKADTVLRALQAEYAFYAGLFDLDVADDLEPLDLYSHR